MKIKVLDPRAKDYLPKYATPGSAAMDLHALLLEGDEQLTIYPEERVTIGTGLAIHIENPSVAAHVLPRSGLATKYGITVANSPGLIDSDYTGELKVCLHNQSGQEYIVRHGDRIAQLEFVRIQLVTWDIVEVFNTKSVRGDGGFGSTGN